ncbi:MAG TPA: choice-of-anchor tandem repeat GloVer-containing protein, partial [Candidatus Binatia bacterium]|nr:choice-of-anchor tandem repeat GloVer-containing protein [Candidatus Binatia bacterium]
MKRKIILILIGLSFLFLPLQAQINLLLDVFSWQGNNGAYPYGSPVISGSTLYGMTYQGGSCAEHGEGTIFKVQLDGTGFTRLHEFCDQYGSYPYGSLIVAGTTLFGMTTRGGSAYSGTIFRVETDGTGFTLLHLFDNNGSSPYGSLVLSGSTLYGMTQKGGINNKGTIFKIETNGTGFTLLHEFAGGSDDGAYPYGSLIISGPTLFGMTENGGAGDQGTIFKIQADGSGFSLKHSFAGGSADGALPKGDLLISGSTLFGMTRKGGGSDNGTIFKIQINGTGFALLHQFAGGPADGGEPWGALAISGSTLFGMTRNGGNMNMGTIFRVETDGNGFLLMHKFAGHPWGGAQPHGSLLFLGSTLYGMTSGGGFHASGIVFSIDPSACNIIHVSAPVGGETWKAGSSHD